MLRRLVRPNPNRADVSALVEQAEREGYAVSHADAEWAWGEFCNSQAAGWMSLYDAPSVNVQILLYYLDYEVTDA